MLKAGWRFSRHLSKPYLVVYDNNGRICRDVDETLENEKGNIDLQFANLFGTLAW
jgi:hypothetical protein